MISGWGPASELSTGVVTCGLAGGSLWPALVKMLIGLSLIIGVMFLLAALLRRLRLGGTNQAQAVIRIKESRAIGSKRLLCLVEVKGRELLLGVTPEKIETLCQFKADPAQSGFDQALKEQDRA